MSDIINSFSTIPLDSLLVLTVLIIIVLYALPITVKRLRITKIGKIEFDKTSEELPTYFLYELTEKVHSIDTDFREHLWSMTEGLFDDVANNSDFNCSVCISHVLFSISDYIRTLILLGISYQMFSLSEEETLYDRLRIGVTRGVRRSKEISLPQDCPVSDDMDKVMFSRYEWVLRDWIVRARSVATRFLRLRESAYLSSLKACQHKSLETLITDMLETDRNLLKTYSTGGKK